MRGQPLIRVRCAHPPSPEGEGCALRITPSPWCALRITPFSWCASRITLSPWCALRITPFPWCASRITLSPSGAFRGLRLPPVALRGLRPLLGALRGLRLPPLVRFGDYAFPLRGKVPNEGRRKRGVRPIRCFFLWRRVLCYAIIEGKISGNEGELCRKRAATAAASRAMKRR